MHRRKNNPSFVTKKPRVSASGGIVATAIFVVVVMTAAVIAGTNAAVEEGEGADVATTVAPVVTATVVFKAMVRARVMGMDGIRDRVTSPSPRKACGSRSLLQWKRCISW